MDIYYCLDINVWKMKRYVSMYMHFYTTGVTEVCTSLSNHVSIIIFNRNVKGTFHKRSLVLLPAEMGGLRSAVVSPMGPFVVLYGPI